MYPNTFYRVSVKAYITNDKGQVFVVKENDKEGGSWWGLPGGGLDHGELPKECLKREMQEELGIEKVEVNEVAYTKTFYMDRKDAWLIWIVYRAKIQSDDFTFADGVTDAKFIDVKEIKSSEDMFETAIVEVDRALRA
ncbi:NUDIX hydrolase [Candidatus Saccharibacteria bacterium]|nr:NUDIX hydrolase [Candidatus Saccharibacteria bacterium]